MKRIIRTTILLALALLVAFPSQARKKNQYEITLTINGGKDTLMYLGHYQAKGNSVVDTAIRDKKGRFVFEGTDSLPEGLYFFAN